MKPDRLFLDASILFSVAHESPGLRQLWELARKNQCLLLASRYVIEKAQRNIHGSDQKKRLESCLSNVEIVLEADARMLCPIDLLEKDRAVFMAAVCAKADYLLTGDNEYFGKYLGQTIMGVKIFAARDYHLNSEFNISPLHLEHSIVLCL